MAKPSYVLGPTKNWKLFMLLCKWVVMAPSNEVYAVFKIQRCIVALGLFLNGRGSQTQQCVIHSGRDMPQTTDSWKFC